MASELPKPVAAFMRGKDIVLDNPVSYAVNTFLMMVVPFLALLGGVHGLYILCEKGRNGEKFGPADIFQVCFDKLGDRILFVLPLFALGFFGALGLILLMAVDPTGLLFLPGLAVFMILVIGIQLFVFPYAICHSAIGGASWMDAWKWGVEKGTANLVGVGVYNFVVGFLGALGFILCYIPGFVTQPMMIIAHLEAYAAASGGAASAAPAAADSGIEE